MPRVPLLSSLSARWVSSNATIYTVTRRYARAAIHISMTSVQPETWQETLEKQSIADARAFEKQLRASALRDREKLRTLVGNNYRDLLRTAEQIVELDEQVHNTELRISKLSQACQPSQEQHVPDGLSQTVQTASQLKLADQMIRCASKATKERSVVLAARLLVITRLLLQYLGQCEGVERSLQWLQNRHKTLRQHLLASIDKLLARPVSKSGDIFRAIVAYCLITSSSTTDAVEHFQVLRTQKISSVQIGSNGQSREAAEQVIAAKCQYLINSVATIKSVSGRELGTLLDKMQKQPLLDDESLSDLKILHLDIDHHMVPKDILSFTPYFKKTLPSVLEIHTISKSWVKQNFEHVLADIEKAVQRVGLGGILRLRNRVLEILLPVFFTSYFAPVVEALRDRVSNRVTQILSTSASSIVSFADDLEQPTTHNLQESLWNSGIVKQVKSQSSDRFVKQICLKRLGTGDFLVSRLRQLRKWSAMRTKICEQLEGLSRIRWQDKIEEYDDDDEELALATVALLAKTDPRRYCDEHDQALSDSAGQAAGRLCQVSEELLKSDTSSAKTQNTTALLRLCREVRLAIGDVIAPSKMTELETCIASLQKAFVQSISTELFAKVDERSGLNSHIFSAEDLPSPLTIAILKELCEMMHHRGGLDLWTPMPRQELCHVILEHILSDEHRKQYIRTDFDKAYLSAALGQPLKDMDDIVARKAMNHWNRTKALFGILAG